MSAPADGISSTRRAKRAGKFSKVVVAFVIAANVLFSGAVLLVFLKTGNEPVALVGAWFSFTTVELWNLAMIKKNRMRQMEEQ